MAEASPVRILIAGAGIGGLATAISLARVARIPDLDVQIYEQAPELREIGASIALSPNVSMKFGLSRRSEQGRKNLSVDRACERWSDWVFMRP